MSFFQKVMSTVSGLVQTNIKGFDVEKEPVSSGGIAGQWKVHNAIKSDKSRTPGSAFIFQKSQLSSLRESEREEYLTTYKREALSIARLRHPAILSIQEPLLDDKTFLAFVTERVECSLATALQKPELFQEHCSSDIEMQMHLLELADALMFLHNDVRMVHLDINPNSIYITSSGKWKLGSLAFCQQIVNKNELVEAQHCDFSSKGKPSPQFNFASPELLQSPSKCNYQSDVFSFGMVILRMLKYRNDKISFPEFHSIDDYRRYVTRLPSELSNYSKYYPLSLIDFLSRMISTNPMDRPQISEFPHLDWFKDPLLQAFNLLVKITELDQSQQISFLKGLQQILFAFEPSLLRKRIFPVILDLTRYDYITPQVLKILIDAMRRDDIFDQNAYRETIWPKIKGVTQGKEIPAQALYDLVSNIPVFHKFVSIEELQATLVPLVAKCYECKVPKLQDIALRVTPYLVQHSEYSYTKSKILPRILSLCCDPNVDVRKTSLICLHKFIDVIDRNFLCEQVISTLDKVKSVGTDRSINQITLKIYQQIAKSLPVELIATKILPQITPFLMESQLTRSEFDDYMHTLKSLLDRIQEERYKTLETVNSHIPPLDLSLEIPEPVKRLGMVGDQFDFLQQFAQQGKSIQPAQNTVQQQHQQPQPAPQQQLDPFGFSTLLQQPQTVPIKTNQPNFQQPIQHPIAQHQIAQQPIVQQPIVQQQPLSFNNHSTGLSAFTSQPITHPEPVQNDPWAQFAPQDAGKKLSQRPMFGSNPLVKQSSGNSQATTQAVDPFANFTPAKDIWQQTTQVQVPTTSKPQQQQPSQQQRNYDAFDLI